MKNTVTLQGGPLHGREHGPVVATRDFIIPVITRGKCPNPDVIWEAAPPGTWLEARYRPIRDPDGVIRRADFVESRDTTDAMNLAELEHFAWILRGPVEPEEAPSE